MKVKEEPKQGCIRPPRQKPQTTEETHNFNIDNEEAEVVKGFAYLGPAINSNADSAKKSRSETQKGSNGRIRKDP